MNYRKLSAPLSVQIEATEVCNNDCLQCYNHWREKSNVSGITLSESQFSQISDIVIDSEVFTATVTGGEPLLFWRNIMRGIKNMIDSGVDVSLNSNLILFTDEVATAVKYAGVKSILTSVLCSRENIHDSITGIPGSFNKTISGIKKAVEYGFRVSSNMVLIKNNYPFIYETALFLKNLGVSCFCATKASPALNSRNFNDLIISKGELKSSLEELERIKIDTGLNVDILECYPLCLIGDAYRFKHFARRSCAAGTTTCTIGASGDIRPCSHSDTAYGNIFNENFPVIWNRMDDWRELKYIPDKCMSCKFIKKCSGGCRIEAKYHGNIKGRDPYMSCEEDVIVPDKKMSKKKQEIHKDEKFHFSSNLKIRKEDFGGVLFIPKSGVVPVNKDAYKIIGNLMKESSFSIFSVTEKFSSDIDTIRNFFVYLKDRGVVLKLNQ